MHCYSPAVHQTHVGCLVLLLAVGCGDRADRGPVDATPGPDAAIADGDGSMSQYDPILGNPFDTPIELDDDRVTALDSSQLPAGSSPCRSPVLARVSNVIDGDTVRVSGISETLNENVRLIGVDTPETTGRPECYGPEASAFTALLEGHLVWLTFDSTCNDTFDRLLAYLHIGGGDRDVWERQLVRRGFGTMLVVGANDALASTLSQDEAAAQAASAGLWSVCR